MQQRQQRQQLIAKLFCLSYGSRRSRQRCDVYSSDGASYHRSIYPDGDVDFYKVHLVSGPSITYEFSANRLSVNSDSFMYLYDTDGTTQLNYSDDCTWGHYDSCIQFAPSVTGDYYIKVMSYNAAPDGGNAFGGILSYTFNAHTFTDNDGDGASSYYDCNDNDAIVYPFATEIPGDGISQNCSGVDELVGTVPDSAEPDDLITQAKSFTVTDADPEEILYRHDLYAGNGRTLDTAGDVDYFKVTVPAYTAYKLDRQVDNVSNCVLGTLYDADGIQLDQYPCSYFFIDNSTSTTAKTFYVSYEAVDGTSTGYYVPSVISYGTDRDGDTYFTRDWDELRDCDDSDALVYAGTGNGCY